MTDEEEIMFEALLLKFINMGQLIVYNKEINSLTEVQSYQRDGFNLVLNLE